MDRRNCSHPRETHCTLIVSWCVRCSGWHVSRVGVERGSRWATASTEVYESHFLPAEETSPDQLQVLVQRVFRSAQEWEQDRTDQLEFDWEWQNLTD